MTTAMSKSFCLNTAPQLRRPPQPAELLDMLLRSDYQADCQIIQSWRTASEECLSIRLVRTARPSSNQSAESKSEWQLCNSDNVLLWSCESRDVELIHNLIQTQIESFSAQKRSVEQLANYAEPWLYPAPAHEQAPINLSGDLHFFQLPDVLQSIRLGRLTGVLWLNRDLSHASIYFFEGTVVDAVLESGLSMSEPEHSLPSTTPEEAFLEVFTWDSGSFSFDSQRQPQRVAITQKVDRLLMDGVLIRDYSDFLTKRGIDEESVFHCTAMLAPDALQSKLKEGLPIDFEAQTRLYVHLTSGKSMYQFLKTNPIAKAKWIPLLFNLVKLGLIMPVTPSGQLNQVTTLSLDQQLVVEFAHDLVRPDSGMVCRSAFAYFIDQQHKRLERFGQPFCVLIFSARWKTDMSEEALANNALHCIADRLMPLLGPMDVLGHYGEFDFGLLLPGEDLQSRAKTVLDGLATWLDRLNLPGTLHGPRLSLTISPFVPTCAGQLMLGESRTYSLELACR